MSMERYFGDDYTDAIRDIKKYSNQLNSVCHKFGVDGYLVESIVFPEFIRNSVFSGMIEEKALELSYIELGSSFIDFSIGKFQIKPSFANRIEKEVDLNPALKTKYACLLINQNEAKAQRIIRIQRLKSIEWQTKYVCCFVDYCLIHYDLKDISTSEKIRFLSTAFNSGIKNTKALVETNFNLNSFPYGSKYKIQQVNYWEVSLDYYIKYCNTKKIEEHS